MADSPTKKEIPFNWVAIDALLAAGCTGREVASYLGCHEDTLYNRVVNVHGILFSEYSAKLRSKGDSFLKKKQFDTAMNGNVTMQIWLGKQRLGQRENDVQAGFTKEQSDKLDSIFGQMDRLQEKK